MELNCQLIFTVLEAYLDTNADVMTEEERQPILDEMNKLLWVINSSKRSGK